MLQIETPILNTVACGAMARPFKTYFNDAKVDMYLRTAPEIFHKVRWIRIGSGEFS